MRQFKLDNKVYQAIVDGTQNGYLEYLHERRRKKNELRVSGAYAWTKGNHIDDQVARAVESLGLNYRMDKAGYTWEYLQFTLADDSEKYLIIIKNSKRTKDFFDGKTSSDKNKNYLTPLSDINNSQLTSDDLNFEALPEQIELELSSPAEIKAVLNNSSLSSEEGYSRFYIVTYEINSETKMIDSIRLTMPSSKTMRLYEIENLTPFIQSSPVTITRDDLEPVLQEINSNETIFSGDQHSFGYSVPSEEERGAQE